MKQTTFSNATRCFEDILEQLRIATRYEALETTQSANADFLTGILEHASDEPVLHEICESMRNSIAKREFTISGTNGMHDTNTVGAELHCITISFADVNLICDFEFDRDNCSWGIEDFNLTVTGNIDTLVQKDLIAYLSDALEDGMKSQMLGECVLFDTPSPSTLTGEQLSDIQLFTDSMNATSQNTHFLVKTNVIISESSTTDFTLLTASDIDAAQDKTIELIAQNQPLEWTDKGAVDAAGYPAYQYAGAEALSALELAILKKHHNIQHA